MAQAIVEKLTNMIDTTVVVVPGKYLPELKVPDTVVSMEIAVDEVRMDSIPFREL